MIKTRRTLDVAQEKGPRLHRQHFPWFVQSRVAALSETDDPAERRQFQSAPLSARLSNIFLSSSMPIGRYCLTALFAMIGAPQRCIHIERFGSSGPVCGRGFRPSPSCRRFHLMPARWRPMATTVPPLAGALRTSPMLPSTLGASPATRRACRPAPSCRQPHGPTPFRRLRRQRMFSRNTNRETCFAPCRAALPSPPRLLARPSKAKSARAAARSAGKDQIPGPQLC